MNDLFGQIATRYVVSYGPALSVLLVCRSALKSLEVYRQSVRNNTYIRRYLNSDNNEAKVVDDTNMAQYIDHPDPDMDNCKVTLEGPDFDITVDTVNTIFGAIFPEKIFTASSSIV